MVIRELAALGLREREREREDEGPPRGEGGGGGGEGEGGGGGGVCDIDGGDGGDARSVVSGGGGVVSVGFLRRDPWLSDVLSIPSGKSQSLPITHKDTYSCHCHK